MKRTHYKVKAQKARKAWKRLKNQDQLQKTSTETEIDIDIDIENVLEQVMTEMA